MKQVSIFQHYISYEGNKSLLDVLTDIRQGAFKEKVNLVRAYIDKNDKQKADFYKNQLPAFTPSGTFEKGRKINLLTTYSQLIILDIDKLSQPQLAQVKSSVIDCPHTLSAFISPSGNGLKIIVPVISEAHQHKTAFQQVASHYEKLIDIKVDQSGKDVSRLCFMSYDPECYINPHAQTFNITQKKVNIEASIESTDWQKSFLRCVEFTQNKETYCEGNRNNFIYLLACNCNRSGIPKHITESYCMSQFDLSQAEIIASVKSAYNESHEHAKFANFANKIEPFNNKKLGKMALIPDNIFKDLPSILKNGCSVFQDKRERDVFFTGAIAILSGCIRNVIGLYDGKELYCNLYVFIIAPAASGKGALTFAKNLGDKFHEKLLTESQTKRKIYDLELQEYKRKISDKKTEFSELVLPEEPSFKILFIPANNSSSRVIQHLKEGDSQGIFCETEADSMGATFKQDWGNYSDLLRKAFHHETISLSRKTNNEFSEIKKPRLSVALAGTPGQVHSLIKTSEDGLFSRFIFYTFKSDVIWRNVNESVQGINLTQHFELLSSQVLNLVEFLSTQKSINFRLTPGQWVKLNSFGNSSLSTLTTFVCENMSSTSKRLAVILYRTCMILTALRYFDNGETASEFVCNDIDFDTAFQLIKIYEEHAVYMFNEMPKDNSFTDKTLKRLFDILPEEFQRKEAIIIAFQELGIKERTIDEYLKKLVASNWLQIKKYGIYEKSPKKTSLQTL